MGSVGEEVSIFSRVMNTTCQWWGDWRENLALSFPPFSSFPPLLLMSILLSKQCYLPHFSRF